MSITPKLSWFWFFFFFNQKVDGFFKAAKLVKEGHFR